MKLQNIIPAVEWLRNYRPKDLGSDLTAGFTVAVMLVPQGMAYAMLAGLPPVVGLYASTFPLLVYAFFGTSRQLAVGPVAIVSLLVSVAVGSIAAPGSKEYIAIALLLALMTGGMQVLFGLLRMGFLVNFLSHAVISGFTSAAAIVIGLSQLKHLLGIQVPRGHSVLELVKSIVTQIPQTHLITSIIGIVSIAFLFFFKQKFPRFPAPLVVVGLSTLAVYLFHLENHGVAIVSEVVPGLPSLSVPPFTASSAVKLLPASLTIVFVGYMESIAVSQTIATKEKYKVDANKELLGLGLANTVSAFFSGYPVTGGFSRTAVNYQAGARTGLASMITAVVVLLTLLFLTPLFFYLPRAVLAAIILVAVAGLVDVKEAAHLFKLKASDGWTLTLTFTCTLFLGIEEGIITGVIFSLLLFIWRSAHPYTAILGYVEEKDAFLDLKRFPQGRSFNGVLIIRVDASMYFANTRFIENRLRDCLLTRDNICCVVFDLSGVNDIDAVALEEMKVLANEYGEQDIQFAFAEMKGPVRDLFIKARWPDEFRKKIQYQTLSQLLDEMGATMLPRQDKQGKTEGKTT